MMLKNTKKKEEEVDEKLQLNKGVELMLQRRRASSSKFNLGNSIQGNNVLAIALTFGTLVAVLFLFVGGIIGWLYKQHQQRTDILRCILRCMTSKVMLFQMKSLPFDLKT